MSGNRHNPLDGLRCPHCQGPLRVTNSRPWGGYHRRTRRCFACRYRLVTAEVPIELVRAIDALKKTSPLLRSHAAALDAALADNR